MMKLLFVSILAALLAVGCEEGRQVDPVRPESGVQAEAVLPITGTFINLAYQDVRNLYTNPPYIDNTDPQMWEVKIREMKEMGMEYLVFMAVANEGRAYYPSGLMPWQYPSWRKSPVDAIMDTAAELGMKVFMSTGWAKDQDDNLRIPAIKQRQMEMMAELAAIYGGHPAFYGWYLPVEDCMGPVLTDYAVDAVNALTARARELTPSAKILISPYGIFNSDFDDPRYEQQVSRLQVDIIAYQDEVGCVREKYPLTRLRENWKKLRAIHDKTGVEMWANCESFAWEKGTNDRTSALIPASFSRLLSQQAAATVGGVDRIISFMMCGIYENPESPYQLGQPHWSGKAYDDYMSWLEGNSLWKHAEGSWLGKYGQPATEDPADTLWTVYEPGTHEVAISTPDTEGSLLVRMLNCCKDGIAPPAKLFLFASEDGEEWSLTGIKDSPAFPNTNHDAFVDCVLFEGLVPDAQYHLTFTAASEAYMQYRTATD